MLIILEGVDCSGKTWMAERLLKQIPNTIIMKHGTKPKSADPKQQMTLKSTYEHMYDMAVLSEAQGFNVIFDRYFLSELVYAPIKRDYDPKIEYVPGEYYWELEEKILQLSHLLVYVYADIDIIKSRLESRGDDYIVDQDLPLLQQGYDLLVSKTRLCQMTIASSDLSIDVILNYIDYLNVIANTRTT